MPSCSPGRCSRVVADTAISSSGKRGTSLLISVPLPAPDGPVTTKTFLPIEEPNQLRPLALGEAADRLRLADPALVQEAGGLDASELRDRHEHVEDLRGRDPFRWIAQDLLDPHLPGLQVLLELRPPDPDVVCALQRLHALIERANRCLSLGLGRRHGAPQSTNLRAWVKRQLFGPIPGVFWSQVSTFGRGFPISTTRFSCAKAHASSGAARPSVAASAASSSRIRVGAPGSPNRTVPRATCSAPAAISSRASPPVVTPPIPTIGIRVAR